MNYHLLSENLSIEVTEVGIELCSLKSNRTGLEYMWQGNPNIWGSHAPVLFPIIGSLKNGEFCYMDEMYATPKHGLVRNSKKVKLVEQTDKHLKFELHWDEETLKVYPFKFRLEVCYKVVGNTIQVSHVIHNESNHPMFYSVGGHPAFNCPLLEGESYEDYHLEFEHVENDSTWLLDSNGLVNERTQLMFDNSKTLPLHKDLFNNDALIFKNLKSRRVSLTHNTRGPMLSMDFEDFNYLGLWAKPDAPFVCIEPWLGITDSSNSDQHFEKKEGIIQLDPRLSNRKSYSITIHE